MKFMEIKKKFNIKYIIYFFYLPILIILRLISKIVLIRFTELISERIGHFVCCMELHLWEKQNKKGTPDVKVIDLFIMGKNISNEQIKIFFKKKFIILPRLLLGPLININKIIPGGDIHNFYFRKNLNDRKNFVTHRDTRNLIDRSDVNFSFSKKDDFLSQKISEQIGIDLNKKFITINLRDYEYFKKYHNQLDKNYWNVKNCNIEDYKLSIQSLINNGYQVIRTGKASEKKLNINSKYYFDITNHELRTDMFELYLASKSKFLIGCNSGATYANLYLFKKPTYISNALPIGLAFTNSNKILTNFKSILSKKDNNKISLTEMYERGLFFYESSEKYNKDDLYYKDIDPIIIQKSVEELMLRCEKKWIVSDDEIRLKKKFLDVYNKILNNHDEKYHGEIRCHFGYEYLKANEGIIK